jgi:mannose-6-phosphate isomerase-like protein (cupin superfamily)
VNTHAWQIFSIDELTRGLDGAEPEFREFLRTPSLSCAVYHLPAGSRDMQAPHLEDEVYLVVSGKARLRVDNQERAIGPGNILFIQATSEHSFFDIDRDLTLIAIFGPSTFK